MDKVTLPTKEMKKDYWTQMDRAHVSSMWYSPFTAQELGMHEDIMEAFDNIGAGSLLSMNYDTYPALTSEFLASLETNIQKPCQAGYIRFRLGNKARTVPLEKWNEIFGFPNPTAYYTKKELRVDQTWGLLTGHRRLPDGALKVRDVASPLFKVILRILGNSIWARRENSRPMLKEIGCITGMLFVSDRYVNLGFELLHHLFSYGAKDGELWVGGMITRLAVHYDVNLANYTSLAADYIDHTYLLQAGIIEMKNGKRFSRFVTYEDETRVNIVPLSPDKMDLMHIPNWYSVWACDPSDQGPAIAFDARGLRRRRRRVYPEEVAPPLEIEQGGGDENVEMAHTPEVEYPQDYGWHGYGTTMASGSGTTPEYPAFYYDLCTRMDGLTTSVDGVRKSVDEVRTSFEERNKQEDERWSQTQDFMTYIREHFDPSGPGPTGTPPSFY